MGDDDPKFGPVAMCTFWAAALLTSWALLVVTWRTLARVAVLVGLLSLVFVVPVGAQTFTPAKEKPPVCTVECPAGPKGDPGKDGRDGRDGRDAQQCPVRGWREFDLGTHAVPFPVLAVVTTRFCEKRILAYSPAIRAAVLVNPDTGMGEVALHFTADLPPDARGPIVFDDVRQFDNLKLLWAHRGGHWLHQWPLGLPVWDLRAVTTPGPQGPEAIFRWRDGGR